MSELRESTITAGEHTMRCVEAHPDPGEATGAGLVVIHDVFGLTPVARGHAERLADNGYLAVLPDLFDRGGPRAACVVRTLAEWRRGRGEAWTALDATRRHLVELGADEGRIGAIGFCMGGGFAIAFAHRRGLKVAAPFYGEVPKDVLTAKATCPVVGGWGAKDRNFAKQGRALADHLDEIGCDHDIVVYPGVGHSYMDDHRTTMARLASFTPMRVGYDREAAEDSWRRVFAFFAEHL